MDQKWRARLVPGAIAIVILVGVGFIGMDMMLSAPPIDRATLETLPEGEPVLVTDLVGHGLDTVCVLPPEQKRVPETARDAAAINDFLKTRTYGGDETHWALVTRQGKTFSLARFERTPDLDIALDETPEAGQNAVPCAGGEAAELLKTGGPKAGRIHFGERM